MPPNRYRLLHSILAGCLLAVILCVMLVCVWMVSNFDRIPTLVAGDSFTDWQRGQSLPWPGEGPAPTPDGSRIFYSSPRTGRGDIYAWDRATGLSQRLTTSDDLEGQPAVSPDGEWIAFQRQERDLGRWRIWIMRCDGSNQHPLSNPKRGSDSGPNFTADGKRVHFMRSTWAGGKGQTAEFFEVDLATSGELPAKSSAYDEFAVTDEGQTLEVGTLFNAKQSRWEIGVRTKPNGKCCVIASSGAYPLLVNNETEVLFAGEYSRGLWLVGANGKSQRQVFNDPAYILMLPRLHSGKSRVVVIVDRLSGQPQLEMWEVNLTTEKAELLTPVD